MPASNPFASALGSAQPSAFVPRPPQGNSRPPTGGPSTFDPSGGAAIGGGTNPGLGQPSFIPNPGFSAGLGGVGQVPGVTDLPLSSGGNPRLPIPINGLASNPEIEAFNLANNTSFKAQNFTNSQLLGQDFGQIIGDEFTRSQLPFIEARLNFANRQQAENDRQAALDVIGGQRTAIGGSPESTFAREMAVFRLANPDPFSPEELSLQQSQIRQRGAIGLEDAQRSLTGNLARQGLGGSGSAFQKAQLEQSGARQTSEELQRLSIDNLLQSDRNEAEAIDRLSGIGQEEELRKIALAQQLSELLTAERGQFDLSSLFTLKPKTGSGLITNLSREIG